MKSFNILHYVTLIFCICSYPSYGQQKELLKIFSENAPEQQGLSSAVLDSMLHFIKNTNQNIHHITIIRNNHTVLDTDIYPYSSDYIHDLASVTKSITALLVGIAVDKGFVKDENEKVLGFFPEVINHNKLLDSLKIKHLVTMRSGLACSSSDGEKALSNMRKTPDWIKFIFSLPMTSKPGQTFSYCSCNFYLLGEIIYRTTKLTPHEFARKYLFNPLQISNSKWLSNYKKIDHGWGDLFLYPHDMAKIGKLVLAKGKWDNKQIVSEQWISKSLETLSELPDDKGYGYGWWTNDKAGYYEAAGRGRQTISVLPARNMIVTMLGGEFDAGTIGSYIFKSIQSNKSLPEDKPAFNNLNETLKTIALPPFPKFLSSNDIVIDKLNGRMIKFEKNLVDIDSLILTFSSKENGVVTFYKNHSEEKYPFTLSTNTYSIGMDQTLRLPVALKAACENSNSFVLHYNQLCRINNFYFHFKIENGNITTTLEETSNFIEINIASSFK
jgi:CubicO group peptidase (beta-lactamase class C family)